MRTDRSIPEEAAKAKAERELGKSSAVQRSAGIKVTAIVALILGDRHSDRQGDRCSNDGASNSSLLFVEQI